MPPKKKPPPGQFCDLTEKRGIKVYYEVTGPGKTEWQGDKEEWILMLTGSAADLRRTTDQQYLNLSMPYLKVVAYDHRNTGQTTIKDEPCTMDDYADDAAALLEAVIPSDKVPVWVMGVSFGGMVAQHLALRHPKLIKKLVLCCCATGGEGGMSYPIHDWYKPGLTIEDRVLKKIAQANTDRTEEWKEKSKSEFQMVHTLLMRDEKIGSDNELLSAGVMRQLEARKGHDTWEKINQLEMPVLCLASSKDNITPPALVKKLAERIGSNADSKLDFDWGHPFIAADVTAMPYVNQWLRSAPGSQGNGQVWKVVGGGSTGGILVRKELDTTSAAEPERLATNSLVSELELKADQGRLRYSLLQGSGPKTGWVSVKLPGKDLLVKTDEKPN